MNALILAAALAGQCPNCPHVVPHPAVVAPRPAYYWRPRPLLGGYDTLQYGPHGIYRTRVRPRLGGWSYQVRTYHPVFPVWRPVPQ